MPEDAPLRLEEAREQPRERAVIDVARSRFPHCIVWCPLPCLTWLVPFIGHMGIADSAGRIYDFQGPYFVGEDDMAFSKPTRYLQLDPRQAKADWDEAVEFGAAVYSKRMHNLCADNCHSHVAVTLERMRYRGVRHWNMLMLCFWMLFCGRWVSFGRFLASWLPFMVIAGVVFGLGLL